MNKEEALQELQNFKNRTGLSRDKMIDLYNSLKNSDLGMVGIVVNGELRKFNYEPFFSYINTSDIRNVYKTKGTFIDSLTDDDKTEMTKLRQDKLRVGDKLRFERNAFNKRLRELSALEELNQEVVKCLEKLKPASFNFDDSLKKEIGSLSPDKTLLVQLSDLHINELTNEFREQKYSITTASKRLQKFAKSVKQTILEKGIEKVVVFMTGDMCNSDAILSKRVNSAGNKAVSIILAVKLLQMFILDISQECRNISVGAVAGNEGRCDNALEFFTDENLITNSPDFIILNMLKLLFENHDGIRFLDGRNNEQVVNISGQNILFSHGIHWNKGDVGKAVFQTMARYSDKGIKIRYCVFGHLHSTKISDYFMRSSSLVGNNAYATNFLNLNSRASQNMAVICKNGDINAFNVDLQNVDEFTGYDIQEDLKNFGIKEPASIKNEDIILKV